MYINKQFKQTNDSNSNLESDPLNTNTIKLKITSSKNFNNINYTLLPKLNDSERKQISKRNQENLEEKTNMDYKEELSVITTLWDELGITEDYRYQFNKILKHNIYSSKMLFFQEKESLQKFKTSLMKLKKEIYNRENNIENLIKIVKMIDAQKIENKVLLKEVVNIIKNLRLNAVNIVIYINRVRELGFYYYFQGKWDLTKLKNEYMYNNNYLLQMNEDLNFLKDSTLGKYIQLGEKKIDAFFTNCSQLNKENIEDDDDVDKIIIPFSDDLIQLIEQSIYYVIQDQIMDNIYQKKSIAMNKNYNMNGMHRSNSTKIKIKKVPSRPMTSKGIFSSNKYRDIGIRNTIKKTNNLFSGLEAKLSNTFKNVEYNNLFQLSSKLNEPKINLIPESTRIKNRVRNPDCFKTFNNSDQKRIKIEHEVMSSLNSSNGKNRTYYEKNINRNDSSEKILIENEKLKKDNLEIKNELEKLSKKIEENEKFKKKLEDKLILQKKEMDYNSNSVEEIKVQLLKEKKELEQKLKEEIEKSINLKKQNGNQIVNKEIQFQIDKSKHINNIKYVNIYKKHNFQKNKIKNKYKIVYYKEDIDSLINKLKLCKILDNTQSQVKQYFDLQNKIYNKETYLIGQYPIALITKLNEDENQIIGVCSYYYNHNPLEQGILNINFICVIKEKENSYEQINDIIKFIKENENYNKIIINLNLINDNIDNDLINFLKVNLGFKTNITDNKIQLYFINNKENIKYNKGFLCSNSISLLSFTKTENKSNDNTNNDYKYINNLLIDSLLLKQKKIFVDFNKKDDMYKMISNLEKNVNPIVDLILPENKNIAELNSKINDLKLKNKIKDSLCFKNNENIESFGLIRLNLNLFFKNILYLKYKNYYYHRISCENVEVIKDTKNSCVIYNIPTLKEDINILILELNDSIKKILINNYTNIYDSFFAYYNALNEKNIDRLINILIPFFKIEKHLQTNNISNKINIYEDINKNKVLNIGCFDEYIEMEFNKEEEININEQIIYIVDNKDIIVNQEFIIGIIYNKETLVQLIHVQKDDLIEITNSKK